MPEGEAIEATGYIEVAYQSRAATAQGHFSVAQREMGHPTNGAEAAAHKAS